MEPAASRLESILAAAVEITSTEERRAYVAQACAGDSEFQRRVEGMIEDYFRAGSFLEPPIQPPSGTHAYTRSEDWPPAASPAQVGATFGPYKLVERIGEGGMGEVWMAQQTEPVKRMVALKLIKPGMDSRSILARFEAERQALALMDHPNIAKVLDAGATPDGRPYFVMELVKGVTITRYCDERRLTPRQRMELFVPVCQAIQHAHQKGVIHRDIKPSNVLIALYDDRPVPKVIDFGVAKATGQQLTDKSLHTGFGAVVGTLEYMSPEQAGFNQLDIDTRSDIYALGVLLYELLTGSPPFSRKDLERAGMLEMLRVIREQEPSRPSTKLSTAEELPTLAANRGTEPKRLTKLIRGELDWMVMKALEKDRNRRYETVNGFAIDVLRYLADEPVSACPPSMGYRLRKFVRRNRGPVLAASIIALLLIAGIVGTTSGLVWALAAERKAVKERDDKEEARRQTRQALNTMTDEVMEDLLGRQIQLTDQHREFLKKVLAYHAAFAAAKADDPEGRQSRAEGYFRVGRIHFALGEFTDAESAYREAVALQKQLADEFPTRPEYREQLAETYDYLGNVLSAMGRMHDAETAYRDALARNKQLAADFPDRPEFRQSVARSSTNAGMVLRNTSRQDKAELLYREAVAILQQLSDEFPKRPEFRQDLAQAYSTLAEVLSAMDRDKEAEEAYRKALDVNTQLTKDFPNRAKSHVDQILDQFNMAVWFNGVRRTKEAVAAYRELITTAKQLASQFPSRPEFRQYTAMANQNLAVLLGEAGDLRVEAVLREARTIYQQLAADFPNRPDYREGLAMAVHSLANLLSQTGRSKEAEQFFRDAVALHEQLTKELPNKTENPQEAAQIYDKLGNVLCALDRPKEAEEAYRKATAIAGKLAADYPKRSTFRHDLALFNLHLGDVLVTNNQPEGAEAAYREAVALWKQLTVEFPKNQSYHKGIGFGLTNIGKLLTKRGQRDRAIAEFHEAIRNNKNYADVHYALANVLYSDRLDEAIAEYREAIRINKNYAEAHTNLGNSLARKGEIDEAITEYRTAIRIDKDLFEGHLNLGVALRLKDQIDDSIAECKEAIRINKDSAQAHDQLGLSLQEKGQLKDAIAEYHTAIRLDKGHVWAQQHLRDAEQLVALDKRLPAILQGKDKPKDAGEWVRLARLCRPPFHEHYAAAVRFFGEAFAADPKLAENLETWDRYNAACAAALAMSGQGKDAAGLDEKEHARLRGLALNWLRADLLAWARLLDKEPATAPVAAHIMQHWLDDTDFARVRGADAIAKLPEAERQPWQKLWEDVVKLQKRAKETKAPRNKPDSK